MNTIIVTITIFIVFVIGITRIISRHISSVGYTKTVFRTLKPLI